MASALLLSPSSLPWSPDSSSSSLSRSPSSPPKPSLDFLSASDDSPTHSASSYTNTTPPATPTNPEDAVPTPQTPHWAVDGLSEEWIPQDISDNAQGSPTIHAGTHDDSQATMMPFLPLETPRPPPPPPSSSSSAKQPLPFPSLSRHNTAPRIPSSLRHAFTASTASSLDHTASTDATLESREASFVDGGSDNEGGTSVLDFAAVSEGKDDNVFLLGSSLPPSAGMNADVTFAPNGDDEDDEGEASNSAGSFVVNTFIERSGQGLAGGTQLRAAVQALRGPGGGILAEAEGVAEGAQASEQKVELEAVEEKMKGLGMGGVGGGKKVGLMGLFEPLSPEAQPAAPVSPLASSLPSGPTLSAFSFSPPPLHPQHSLQLSYSPESPDSPPVERNSSRWKDLMHFSPSPPPPSVSKARPASSTPPPLFSFQSALETTSGESTPVPKQQQQQLQKKPSASLGFRTPGASTTTAGVTPAARRPAIPAVAQQATTGVGRRDRYLHRSTSTRPPLPAVASPPDNSQEASSFHEEDDDGFDEDSEDVPFVPPPVLAGEGGEADMSTASDESMSSVEDEEDEDDRKGTGERYREYGATQEQPREEEEEGFTTESERQEDELEHDEEEEQEEQERTQASWTPSDPSEGQSFDASRQVENDRAEEADEEEGEGDEEEEELSLPSRSMSALPSPSPSPASVSVPFARPHHLSFIVEEEGEHSRFSAFSSSASASEQQHQHHTASSRSTLAPPLPSPYGYTLGNGSGRVSSPSASLELPNSPARIPIPSPLLVPTLHHSSRPSFSSASPLPAAPPSPYKLFQPTYDTLTRTHLLNLVDEIDELSASPEALSRSLLHGASPGSRFGDVEQQDEAEEGDEAGEGGEEMERSEEGFLGEEGIARSSKRIKLSPRSEFKQQQQQEQERENASPSSSSTPSRRHQRGMTPPASSAGRHRRSAAYGASSASAARPKLARGTTPFSPSPSKPSLAATSLSSAPSPPPSTAAAVPAPAPLRRSRPPGGAADSSAYLPSLPSPFSAADGTILSASDLSSSSSEGDGEGRAVGRDREREGGGKGKGKGRSRKEEREDEVDKVLRALEERRGRRKLGAAVGLGGRTGSEGSLGSTGSGGVEATPRPPAAWSAYPYRIPETHASMTRSPRRKRASPDSVGTPSSFSSSFAEQESPTFPQHAQHQPQQHNEHAEEPSDSPPPLPHFVAAASASLRATLTLASPSPSSSSSSSRPHPHPQPQRSPALGSKNSLRLPSGLQGMYRDSLTREGGRRKFANLVGMGMGSEKGVKGLFADAEDDDEEEEEERDEQEAVVSAPPPPPQSAASSRKPPSGHARASSLTTIHPSSSHAQQLLASSVATAREKGLVFDREMGRWIRTPGRRLAGAGGVLAEEDEQEEHGECEGGVEAEEEDPFQDFSELKSNQSIQLPPPPSHTDASQPPPTPLSFDLDALPRAGDGSDAASVARLAVDLSGLGISKGTPPLPPSSSSTSHLAPPLPPTPSGASPANTNHFSPLPTGEGGEMVVLELESEDSATWGRGEGASRREEAEKLFKQPKEERESRHRPTHSTPVAVASLPWIAVVATPTPAPAPTPATAARPLSTPAKPSPSAVALPRSALKQPSHPHPPHPIRTQSAPNPATTISSTPLRSFTDLKLPRSVSFSDGKTSGKIEGLVEEGYRPSPLRYGLGGGGGGGEAFGGGGGPGELEMDETVEEEESEADGEGDTTVRGKRIGEALDELAGGIDDASPARPYDTTTSFSAGLSSRRRSFTRTASAPSGGAGNQTFLTECSFGVSHDRLLQYITDVEPFEPDWEGLKSIDLSGKKAESVVRMKEFLPRLDEVNLNINDLTYLTGVPSSLRTLLIASNRLTSLTSFQHLLRLERLDLSNNDLDSVAQLACLFHLRELKADGNRIRSLEGLEGLDALVKVSLKGNEVEEVDFSRMKWARIETLHLARNKISSVQGLNSLVSLFTLNLDHNLLTTLDPAADMPRLRVLRLCNNPLPSLDISFAPKLRTLYVDSAKLGAVSGTEQLRKLENLSVRDQSGGALTLSMPHIRDVKRLYLSGNPLPTSFPSEKFFNLVYLELAMCQLTSLPTNLASVIPNVRVLNLDYNFLADLDPLAGLTRMTKLSVVGNRLAKARPITKVLSTLVELETVDFRMNPFTLAFYPPLVPSSDGLLPSHAEHRILHPDSLSSALSPSTISDPSTSSRAWQVLDTKFRRALPDEWYHKRTAYRSVVLQSTPALVRLDGIDCAKERPKLAKRLEKLARKQG